MPSVPRLIHVVQLICEQNFCSPLIPYSLHILQVGVCVLVRRRPLVSKTARDRISQIEAAVKQPV